MPRVPQLHLFLALLPILFLIACSSISPARLEPIYITPPVRHDTDDPAIWINPEDPARSLILGTDKETDGALMVYNLKAEPIDSLVLGPLLRPNNVDVEYDLMVDGEWVDIAVVTERERNMLRVFSLPDLRPLDGGGIPVFEGDSLRAPMGISLYRRAADGAIFAFVSRKRGPLEGYLAQYRLDGAGDGPVTGVHVRNFGAWSGIKEIEAIVVDDDLGFVYYSDEQAGVRKYHADPDHPGANRELAFFAREGFAKDHEGLSVLATSGSTGYILVSDQGANRFQVYTREGSKADSHDHDHVGTFDVCALDSDGSEITHHALGPDFPAGLFVVMSTDRKFHYYDVRDVIAVLSQ